MRALDFGPDGRPPLAAHPARNPWNGFQAAVRGHGLGRAQLREAYHLVIRSDLFAPKLFAPSAKATAKATAAKATNAEAEGKGPARAANRWNAFQKAVGGKGFTRGQIRGIYAAALAVVPARA